MGNRTYILLVRDDDPVHWHSGSKFWSLLNRSNFMTARLGGGSYPFELKHFSLLVFTGGVCIAVTVRSISPTPERL